MSKLVQRDVLRDGRQHENLRALEGLPFKYVGIDSHIVGDS